MAIAFSCPSCQRTYTLDEKYAGKVATCKTCSTRMVVPDAEGDPDPEPEPPPKPRARVVSASPPPPPRRDPTPREQAEAEDEAPERPRRSAAEEAAYYAKKAARRQRRKEREAEIRSQHGNSLAVSRTIVGGVATMAIAVVWFGTGLMFNVFFIFPPIMFLFGLLSFVKGLMGQED